MHRTKLITICWLGALVAGLVALHPGGARAAGVGGTLNLKPIGGPVEGSCSQSYADVCPSNTGCVCQQYAGKLSGHFGGRSGRGTANLYMTIDNGMVTAEPKGCRPVFGSAFLSTPLGSVDVNVTGTFCDALGNSTLMKLMGGFGAGGALGSGFGTLSGSFNLKKNNLVISFSGRTQ